MKRIIQSLLLLISGTVFAQNNPLRVLLTDPDNWVVDPPTIRSSETHMIVKSLFPTLVEWDDDTGQLVSGLADKFYWKDNELFLHLREGHKSTAGDVASADDLIFSLKRLFNAKSGTSLPGHLDRYLCSESKDGKKDCPNLIKVDKMTVKMKFPSRNAAYVDFLANPRYSIILAKTVDPATQNIVDYKNTLGAYFVESQTPKELTIKANKGHWSIRSDSPQDVVFIRPTQKPLSPPEKIQLLRDNKIDYIGLYSAFGHKEFQQAKEIFGNKGSYFLTDELSSVNLRFTKKAMTTISRETRQLISKVIQDTVNLKRSSLPTYKRPTIQFLIPGSYGSLSPEQEKTLLDLRKKLASSFPPSFKLKVGVPNQGWKQGFGGLIEPLLPQIDFVIIPEAELQDVVNSEGADAPDMIGLSCDMAFRERFSHLGWLLDVGYFNIRGKQAEEWLDSYTKTADKQARREMLNKLHFDSVATNPSVVSIYNIPLRAVALNGWKLDRLSEISPQDALWKIHK